MDTCYRVMTAALSSNIYYRHGDVSCTLFNELKYSIIDISTYTSKLFFI